jgi:hypothetical protein
MRRLRCCELSSNHVEGARVDDGSLSLYCRECGTVLAIADDRGDLYADY